MAKTHPIPVWPVVLIFCVVAAFVVVGNLRQGGSRGIEHGTADLESIPSEPAVELVAGETVDAEQRSEDADGTVYGAFTAREGGDVVVVEQRVDPADDVRADISPADLRLVVDGRSVAPSKVGDSRQSSGGPVHIDTWFSEDDLDERLVGTVVELEVTTRAGTTYSVDGLEVEDTRTLTGRAS